MINGNRIKSTRGRSPRDLYETPWELAHAAISVFEEDEHCGWRYGNMSLDAGCGSGVWGEAMRLRFPNIFISGVDIDPEIPTNDYYDMMFINDYLKHDSNNYDIVFGNPPYSLAEEFIRHAYGMIKPGGYIYFLLRLSFLEGIDRCKHLFKEIPLKRVYVCSRRPSFFSSDGVRHTTDTLAYAMFLWQRLYIGKPTISFMDWNYK